MCADNVLSWALLVREKLVYTGLGRTVLKPGPALATSQTLGVLWLLQENKRVGKMASSLVIYMKGEFDFSQGLRMGKRVFRTTEYDWNR